MVIYKGDFALGRVEKARLEFGGTGQEVAGIRGEDQGVAEDFGEQVGTRARLCR